MSAGTTRLTVCWLAAGIVVLAAHSAHAQDRRDAAIVVTASRSGEGVSADKLGASVTVLDADALDLRQTRVVSDVLRDVPGLAVSRTGGVGGLTQVRVRGTEGNHVLVLIDGIEAADPYQGEYDFGMLIADPAARIEVLRGQQSALYGSDAIGGVIHYITPSGAEMPGLSMRAEAGSFETATGAVRAAGVAGDLDYALSGAYFHTGGTPTARGGERDLGADLLGLSAKLAWAPRENFNVTGVARYNRARAEQNDAEDDPASPLFGHIVDSPGVYSENSAFYGLLSAELRALDGRWINRLSAQFADTMRDNYAPAGKTSGSTGQRLKGSFTSSLGFEHGIASHRLTAALDAERESFRNTTPSPFVFGGERHIENVGIAAQYELQVGEALSLGASVRRDENDRFADVTTWRVQGSYALPSGTRVRGAWGSGIKNPSYFDLYGFVDGEYIGNPDLRPERSKGWEAGIEQGIGGAATIGLTWLDSTLEDEIFVTFPPPDFVATPGNRPTVSKQQGLEAYLSARPLRLLRLDAAYTYLKARENGEVEARRPKHIASVNATVLSPDERFSGTLTVRYNGEQIDLAFTDPSFVPVRETLDDFVLVNLNARYAVTSHVAVFGRIENLLDEDYEEVFSVAMPGISAYGGVSVRF
jgi:vitamin B12 transporter